MTEELSPAERAQAEREADNRQRRWVESIIHKAVGEVTRQVAAARGDALLMWVDNNGELQARRIQREASVLREFVPNYIRRGNT